MRVYDPDHTIDYGYMRCRSCKAEWYGKRDEPQRHEASCLNRTAANTDYVFGPKEQRMVEAGMTPEQFIAAGPQ